jgi:rod shape-determining protein MreD
MEKYKWLRYFAYTLEFLAVFMIQETPGLVPSIFGARPVLLIPAAVSVALFESEKACLFFGVFAGLLTDFGMGQTLGFHALLLIVACYFLALLAANLIRTNFLTAMISIILIAGGVFLLQWVFFYLLSSYEEPIYVLSKHYLPRYLYTVAVMPIFYYFNRALAIQIRAKEE